MFCSDEDYGGKAVFAACLVALACAPTATEDSVTALVLHMEACRFCTVVSSDQSAPVDHLGTASALRR